ncbi:MAG: beta-galactosidase [Pirellulales bacterium]|nr:beta-galactosidase [Pirellulales bacterium]
MNDLAMTSRIGTRFVTALALLLASPRVFLAAAQESGGELLKNPGFNEDADGNGLPDGWSISPDAAAWCEKADLSKDFEIVSQPKAYVLATQSVSLKPGQRYTLLLTLKGEGGAMGGALLLHGPDKPTLEKPIVWNIDPAAEHELYVASFIAPDPVARLYLYNVARKGTICYDHVSLREGSPDRPFIGTFTLKAIDRPIGNAVPTRHIDWAAPLCGGPIKAFFTIRNFVCAADMFELAQRIDLDYDLVHTGYDGDESVSETGRRATGRLEAGDYEVYVVSSRATDILAGTIRKRVEAGAGLVVLEGFGQGAKFAEPKSWNDADPEHALRNGIPWGLMPEKILGAVQTAEIGRGRAVRLVFPLDKSRVWGFLPMENSMEAYQTRQFDYWEWWHSLLAKAIVWAAHREGNARLRLVRAADSDITVAAEGAPAGARARVILRSGREIRFDRPLLRTPPKELPLDADGRLAIPIPPEMPAGPVIADVVLVDAQGAALTWGSYVAEAAQHVRIARLRADREGYRPGDRVELGLTIAADGTAPEVTVAGQLVDAFGRVVSACGRVEKLAKGEQAVACALPVRDPLCVHHRAEVRLVVDGCEQDSRWIDVLVPEVGPRLAAADFTATAWSPGMTHPALLSLYASRGRELGLNSEFASSLYAASEHGAPCGGYINPPGGVFRLEKHSENGVRSQCLSDPAVVEKYTSQAREAAAQQRPYGMIAVGITDEAFLTSRHRRDEVCFSAHCQERYRKWLQGRHGTLEALNAEWETDYTSWSEIRGARTEDVRGKRNFAPFVDFRTFMTDVWVDACKTVTGAYHEVAPETPVGHTNTFGAEPFNGNDYWKLATQAGFGWGQEYSEAIKPQGQKAIFEPWRSFVETHESRRARSPDGKPDSAAPFFNYGWIGYDHSAPAAHYEPWWLALHGARGLSWYAIDSMDPGRGTSWSLVYPSLQFTPYSLAAQEGLRDLRAGCGKLLLEYTRQQPPIALLWSYPSMLVAWCESKWDEPEPNERPGTDSYGTHFRSALHFRQHVDELQLDYDYLAPEQILDGDRLGRYRLLMLPFTVAISRPLAEKLEKFVESGGILLGDLRCLRTDEHGKPFGDSGPLERLFGVKRGDGEAAYGATKVKFTAAGSGIDLGNREVDLHGREAIAAVNAVPLASHATGEPAVLVRPRGKGLAVYLNFCLPEYDPVTRELAAQLVRRAGIDRKIVAEAVTGDSVPRCYERNTFTRGPVTVHGFIRDHRRASDTDPVRFVLGQTSHVYDVRAGRYLGRTDRVETVLPPGETALVACLPYRVEAVDAVVPAEIAAGRILPLKVAVQADPPASGDHVLHVELLGPDRRTIWHYTRNVLAPGAQSEVSIPLALNDPPGPWTARIRDVLSGVKVERVFQVITVGQP